MLEEFGKELGFRAIIVPPVKIENETISSTLIRNNVAKGNMEKVFELLGRHYSITGTVECGRRIGRKLGFSTANLLPEVYVILPHEGVYLTKTMLDEVLYNSITNIGKNPTFEERWPVRLETHLLDFGGDIDTKSPTTI